MSLHRRDDVGFVTPMLAIALLSMVLGGGAAVVAVSSVVNSYGADDKAAVQTGLKDIVPPDQIISYGG
jgi:hypothetical protein